MQFSVGLHLLNAIFIDKKLRATFLASWLICFPSLSIVVATFFGMRQFHFWATTRNINELLPLSVEH